MAANDFMVGNAPRPADYASPLMNLGQQISALPGQFYMGKEKQAEIALREAFPNGLPRDANGQVDVAAAMDIGARAGGGQWVAPLMRELIYSQAGSQAADESGRIDAGVPRFGAPPAPGGVPAAPPGLSISPNPPGIVPRNQQQTGPAPPMALPPSQQPSPVANEGAPTLRTTIAEAAGANNDVSNVIGAVARQLRINPDKPLTPEEVAAAAPIIKQRLAAASSKTSTDAGSGPPFAPMIPRDGSKPAEANRPPSGPVAGPTPGGASQAGGPARPGVPVPPQPGPAAALPPPGPAAGPVPGQPPVQPPQAPQQTAQAAPNAQPNAPPGGPIGARTSHVGTALEGLVPEGMTAGQFIDANNRASALSSQQAERLGATRPASAAAATERAKLYEARNKPVLDALAKAGEDTPAMKEAIANLGPKGTPLQVEKEKAHIADEVQRGGKYYEAVKKMGIEATEARDQIQVSKSLVMDPNFNSGIGQYVTDTAKRVGALFGDPNLATPNQLFDKIRSGSMLNQIKAMSASGAGVVRIPEMKMIETMIADRSNAPASLRTLLEIEDRLGQIAIDVYHMATNYNGGRLDAGFDKLVAQYKEEHPLFTKEERENHKLIAPPVLRSPDEVVSSGLKPGDPFKTPDGRVKYVPNPTGP